MCLSYANVMFESISMAFGSNMRKERPIYVLLSSALGIIYGFILRRAECCELGQSISDVAMAWIGLVLNHVTGNVCKDAEKHCQHNSASKRIASKVA
jgi:hypothetical protein